MTAKRKSLTGIRTRTLEEPADRAADVSEPVASTGRRQAAGANKNVPPSREGKKPITVYFPPEVRKQLKALANDEDKTVQQLMGEAVNMLFAQYRRPEIAPTERD